jgi:hypothetical protein
MRGTFKGQLKLGAALFRPELRPGGRLEGVQVLPSEQQQRAVRAVHRLRRPEGAVQVDAGGNAGVGVYGVGRGGAAVGLAEHSGAAEVERTA